MLQTWHKICLLAGGLLLSLATNAAMDYGDCGINAIAEKKLEAANKLDKKQYVILQSIAEKKPSEFTCLPTLERIADALNATQFSLTGLAIDMISSQMGNSACEILDDYISDMANQANASWDVPYGVGEVGIGVKRKYINVHIGDSNLTKKKATDIKKITGSRREEAEGVEDDDGDWLDSL